MTGGSWRLGDSTPYSFSIPPAFPHLRPHGSLQGTRSHRLLPRSPCSGRRPHPRAHGLGRTRIAQDSTPENLAAQDAIVIATHHTVFDLTELADNADLIIDTRNAMNGVTVREGQVVKA